ncbi:MAG TPA: hypothetical protein VNS58_08900 [Puia sp.]|nr:hypothetical protein [Puia sp.]
MLIEIRAILSKDKSKKYYTLEWGKGLGQRKATGIYSYVKPKDLIQRNHNKEALALLEIKQSELTIDYQAIGTQFIPTHRFKENF